MKPQFFFDTADADYIRKVWKWLEPHVDSWACLGVTTNPNALSKIDCTTLLQLENVIPTLCELTTEMRDGNIGGTVWVQTPNSSMPFNEIFEWAQYVIQFTDGTPEDLKKFLRGPLRIAIDLDDTINYAKKLGEKYNDEALQEDVIGVLHRWKKQGHYIIIHTARHMNTCDGNLGKVLARQGLTTLQWLKDNDVPYDEIWRARTFPKLPSHVFI